jgi:hypothetical protein
MVSVHIDETWQYRAAGHIHDLGALGGANLAGRSNLDDLPVIHQDSLRPKLESGAVKKQVGFNQQRGSCQRTQTGSLAHESCQQQRYGRSKRFLFFIEFPIFVVKIFLVIIEYQISIPLFSGCATLRIRAAEKITESIIIPVFLILCALVLKYTVSLTAHDFQVLSAKFC